jgi:hypothetical protein
LSAYTYRESKRIMSQTFVMPGKAVRRALPAALVAAGMVALLGASSPVRAASVFGTGISTPAVQTHTIQRGLRARTTLTVNTLPSNRGPAGAYIIVAGHGFLPYELVAVRIYCWTSRCPEGSFNLGVGHADRYGAFRLRARIWPFAPAGQHGIGATGLHSGRFVRSAFTVTSHQMVRLTRSRGPVGTRITIRGTGFASREAVPIKFYCWPNNCGAGTVLLGVAHTNAKGAFSLAVIVPAKAPPGPHGVGGIGIRSLRGASAVFTVLPATSKH